MPQLLILIVIGAGAYVGYRWVRARVRNAALEQGARSSAARRTPKSEQAHDGGELVWDEKAGVYRAKN